MSWRTALVLGRVSNLPTVWTNTLAAIVLAGGTPGAAVTAALLIAISLAYVGGMFLNDAFDAAIDARERPDRPIPAGRVRRETVLAAGLAMLAGCVLIFAALGLGGAGTAPVVAALALAGAILFYDLNHKDNVLAPVVMGLCRALVEVAVALAAAAALPGAVIAAALVMLCHIVGLTYAARQEALDRLERAWPLMVLAVPLLYGLLLAADDLTVLAFLALLAAADAAALHLLRRRQRGDVPRAVAMLIAAICLLDAVYLAAVGALWAAIVAAALFPVTRLMQARIPGT